MINFDLLERDLVKFKETFETAEPFEYVVIDDFCDNARLQNALDELVKTPMTDINKSRDYIFAKNKFEKSDFNLISNELADLKADLLSDRFADFLRKLTSRQVFIDPTFHGGGLHQGGEGSFLDMHVDFNYHPIEKNWFRDLNILIYLNRDWCKEFGGELKIAHVDDEKNLAEISPKFNRAVIMLTRDYTLHGYDPISFPQGDYRRSIAAYAYHMVDQPAQDARTTVWYPKNSGVFKRFLGRITPTLVAWKSRYLRSGTDKNK